MKTVEDLLRDYIQYRSSFIHEFSGDITRSLKIMLNDAKEYARDLSVEWNNNFVDETDWLSMNNFEYPLRYEFGTESTD